MTRVSQRPGNISLIEAVVSSALTSPRYLQVIMLRKVTMLSILGVILWRTNLTSYITSMDIRHSLQDHDPK